MNVNNNILHKNISINHPKSVRYGLDKIKTRFRCSDLKDVSTRHERDTDKAVDDLVTSQSEITR